MVRRVRDALAIAEALAAGQPAAQVRRGLRMPSFAADRLIADVSTRDLEAYRRALELLADLEVESRGGSGGGALSEDTAAVRAVHRRVAQYAQLTRLRIIVRMHERLIRDLYASFNARDIEAVIAHLRPRRRLAERLGGRPAARPRRRARVLDAPVRRDRRARGADEIDGDGDARRGHRPADRPHARRAS